VTTPKRTRPLSVADLREEVVLTVEPPATADQQERDERFAEGVRRLRIGRASIVLSERILLVLGGILAPLGVAVVLLGWWGASQSAYEFEQIPYLISGGLLGLSLVFIGCFFYFAHWLTQLVKEHREQSQAILTALNRLIELEEDD
jgi:hypothetical protein